MDDGQDPGAPRLSDPAHFYLIIALVALWVGVLLPAVLLAVVGGELLTFVATGGVLAHIDGLDQDLFLTALLLSGGILGLGFGAQAQGLSVEVNADEETEPAAQPQAKRSRAVLRIVVVAALSAFVAVRAEWGGNDALPDLLSAVPVMILFLIVAIGLPVKLFPASVHVVRWLYRHTRGRPFVAGMVAGLCTLFATPPLAVGALAISAVVEPPQRAAAALPPTHLPSPEWESTRHRRAPRGAGPRVLVGRGDRSSYRHVCSDRAHPPVLRGSC